MEALPPSPEGGGDGGVGWAHEGEELEGCIFKRTEVTYPPLLQRGVGASVRLLNVRSNAHPPTRPGLHSVSRDLGTGAGLKFFHGFTDAAIPAMGPQK